MKLGDIRGGGHEYMPLPAGGSLLRSRVGAVKMARSVAQRPPM